MSHKKDLKRADAHTCHDAVIAVDADSTRRSVFIDGKEIVMPAGTHIEADWTDDDLSRVTITAYAETIEVISWDEMEKRSY